MFILGRENELPWFGSVLVNELKKFFHINCDVCMHCFREILGSTTLCSMQPQVFFPSHILSYFFTYVTDLLQDLSLVEGITDKLDFGNLHGMEGIRSSLREYVLAVGVLPYAGVSSFLQDKGNSDFLNFVESFSKALGGGNLGQVEHLI